MSQSSLCALSVSSEGLIASVEKQHFLKEAMRQHVHVQENNINGFVLLCRAGVNLGSEQLREVEPQGDMTHFWAP